MTSAADSSCHAADVKARQRAAVGRTETLPISVCDMFLSPPMMTTPLSSTPAR